MNVLFADNIFEIVIFLVFAAISLVSYVMRQMAENAPAQPPRVQRRPQPAPQPGAVRGEKELERFLRELDARRGNQGGGKPPQIRTGRKPAPAAPAPSAPAKETSKPLTSRHLSNTIADRKRDELHSNLEQTKPGTAASSRSVATLKPETVSESLTLAYEMDPVGNKKMKTLLADRGDLTRAFVLSQIMNRPWQ